VNFFEAKSKLQKHDTE